MKKINVFFFLLFSLTVKAQPILSNQTKISIITCGPYQAELYAAFGHSAIRIFDPIHQFDNIYNYGVFNFDQPNFYLNFTRGYLYYKLGVNSFPDFVDYYIYCNRSIHEQVLDLDSAQRQHIFNYLEKNLLPANTVYRYDYFYNNCATKIRDVFVEVLQDNLKFELSFVNTNYTIRNLTDLYLQQQPWGDLGIDICLGMPMDKKATPYEYMFLPNYVESSFDHATLNGKPIVKQKNSIYQSVPEKQSFHWYHPWIVLGGFFLLVTIISYRDWKRKKISRWFDFIFFTVLGLLGWLLVILWIATDHAAAKNNFNLLWAFPLHLVGVVALVKQSQRIWVAKYFSFIAILTSLLIGFWWILPQQMNVYLLPLISAILIRSLLICMYPRFKQ